MNRVPNLFEIEVFSNIIKVFFIFSFDSFNKSLLNKSVNFFKKKI